MKGLRPRARAPARQDSRAKTEHTTRAVGTKSQGLRCVFCVETGWQGSAAD